MVYFNPQYIWFFSHHIQ